MELLAVSLLLGSKFSVALGGIEPPATDADFQKQIKRLEPKNYKPERLKTANWLYRHSQAKNAHLARSALERCIRDDAEPDVRSAAVQSLAAITQKRQEACPLAIIQAMLDKDAMVSQYGDACAGWFKTYSPGTVEILLRCAKSERTTIRSNCLHHLACAGGKDQRVLEAIKYAAQDKSLGVRHNAHVALFHATDNLADFVAYLVRLQEDPDSVLGQLDPDSDPDQNERESREMARLGSAILFVEWSGKRPAELAPALMDLLTDRSPKVRRGAARLIGATVVKTDLPDKRDKQPDSSKVQMPPQPSNTAIVFKALNAENRLSKLATEDPDPTVRAAALSALKRFASIKK
jgi:HEAT repeat protein